MSTVVRRSIVIISRSFRSTQTTTNVQFSQGQAKINFFCCDSIKKKFPVFYIKVLVYFLQFPLFFFLIPNNSNIIPTNMPAMTQVNFFDSLYFPTVNDYTFCPHCGVDVTIYSHEDDCPCVRHGHTNHCSATTTTTTTAVITKN